MRNYKYFILNSNKPNKKLTAKQIILNSFLIISNLIIIGCIFSIPIATYYNSDKLATSIELEYDINVTGKVKSVNNEGKYMNPWPEYKLSGFGGLLKFAIFDKDETNLPSDLSELDNILPVHHLSKMEINKFCQEFDNQTLRITWIGHSTALLNIEGFIILTDPLFSNRASPYQFMGPKRFRPIPIKIEEIPKLNAIIISHNHYDHLDLNSVITLNEKFGKSLIWLIPAGLSDWFKSVGIEGNNVIEFDWWDTKDLNSMKITFTPAQHWSGRSFFDRDRSLWGGWIIVGQSKKVYFAGDTGYCNVFKEIGKYGPFDLSLIPIGAYQPRWFMKAQHVDPTEAVKIHMDVNSKNSVAIHWATFHMAHEYYLAPKEELVKALEDNKLEKESFETMTHGVIYEY